MSNNEQIDFLAIGDMVTDAFIRIEDAKVEKDKEKGIFNLCISFGNKIPYKFVEVVRAVGNSPNASVSANRLGLNSHLVTDLGDDDEGEKCLKALEEEGVSTQFVTRHPDFETNYHYVLWYEDERTILVKHQEYPYKFPEIETPPKWIYLSSLAENSLPYHDSIAEYVKANPDVKLVFQPGTFQMGLGYERLKEIYQLSELFFCNVEEAKDIIGKKNEQMEINELLKMTRDLGPKKVVVTDGPKGAYTYDGEEMWFMPPYPDPKPPVDRTGAGDSFASTFTSALVLGKTIPEALEWAPINSMSVVQEIGAQRGLLTREKLEEYLRNRPDDYHPQKVN
ncbi:MAG: carbohydrate kinase family protein [Candidatus Paceibacterota bacterium]